jgi:hypothetical protein
MASYALPELVLRNYFRAKDENRPHMLERVFAPEAELRIVNKSSTIAFPALTSGRVAIADVLVRDFGRAYENVYSFYLDRPVGALETFECPWLVVMSEKASRVPRVGCGRYCWSFDHEATGLATRLMIMIDEMQVLLPSDLGEVLEWVGRLSYPWCTRAAAIDSMPEQEAFASLAKHLRGEHRSE